MRAAIDITARDLVRVLRAAAAPAIDAAVQRRAEAIARHHDADDLATRILRRGDGIYEIESHDTEGTVR